MQELLSKKSIKDRLIGGEYFSELLIALKNILFDNSKGLSLKNRYIIETYFLGNTYAINRLCVHLGKEYGEKQ